MVEQRILRLIGSRTLRESDCVYLFISRPAVRIMADGSKDRGLEAVLFDAGGVFVPEPTMRKAWTAARIYFRGFSQAKVGPIQYIKSLLRLVRRLQRGGTIKEFWECLHLETGIPPPTDKHAPLVSPYTGIDHLDGSMVDLVEDLRSRGIRVGLVSDTIHSHSALYASKGLYELFHPDVFLSSDYGEVKPALFRPAILRFGLAGVGRVERCLDDVSRIATAPAVACVDDNAAIVKAYKARYGGPGIIHKNPVSTRAEIYRLLNT